MNKISKVLLSVFILVLVSAAAFADSVSPTVTILSPVNGFTTDKNTMDVQVYFRASANDKKSKPTGNVGLILLKIDKNLVFAYFNPPQKKEDTRTVTVSIRCFKDGSHILQAFAYQGPIVDIHEGKSAPVTFIINRHPVVTNPGYVERMIQPRWLDERDRNGDERAVIIFRNRLFTPPQATASTAIE